MVPVPLELIHSHQDALCQQAPTLAVRLIVNGGPRDRPLSPFFHHAAKYLGTIVVSQCVGLHESLI